MPASDATQPRSRKSAPPTAGSCWGGVARLLAGAPPPRRKRAAATPALKDEQPQQAITSKEERLETGSSSNPQPPSAAPDVPEPLPNVPEEKKPEAATKAPAEVEALRPRKSAPALQAPQTRRRVDGGQVCQFAATFLIALMQAVLMASYSTRWATSSWTGPHTALNAHHSTLNASCGRLLTLSQWCFLMTLCACLVEAAIFVVSLVLDESFFRLFDCLGFPPAGFGQAVASTTRLFIIGWSIQALISANAGELLVCHGLSSCTGVTVATFLLLSMLNLNALVQWGRGGDKERSPLLCSEKHMDFGTGRRDSPIPRTISSRSLV